MDKELIKLENIKLIIWDLDETLWNGTISESNIEINKKFEKFINDTLDMGIVHSICSKNNFDVVKNKLLELNLWDLFVFPSIDWSSKGIRIKNIISTMNLRPVNVLFVDDNIQNLNEAKFYCKEIKVALPKTINDLCIQVHKVEKKDLEHKRLKQYRILEKKENLKLNYNSNEEFLMSCNISVEINNNCLKEIDRLHELLMRSNQLNYTKFRQNKEELIKLLNDPTVNAGYVKVHDNFGDYGIVGFFAIKNNKAVHYLFSCRTLGMLIEQWVYMKIGCPEIKVIGEVVTQLNNVDIPKWINQNIAQSNIKQSKNINKKFKILFKGPCDLMQLFSFIKENENIKTEFTYTNDQGICIEGHNNTSQIVTALYSTEEEKKELLNDIKWFDKDMLTTTLEKEKFDIVFLSLLADGNLGLYKKKGTNQIISMCESYYDLTDEKNWSKYIDNEIFTSNIKFNIDDLKIFKEKYEFIPNNDGKMTVQNLEKIYNKIKTRKLVILLGSEKKYEKKTTPGYINRHLLHKKINDKVREWAQNKENVKLIYLGDYIKNSSDYVDSINHFSKKIYYNLAEDIINIINTENKNTKLKKKNKIVLLYSTIKQKLRIVLNKYKIN